MFLRRIWRQSVRKRVSKCLCRISSFYRSSHRRCSAKKVFWKICNIHRKTPVLELLCRPSGLQFIIKVVIKWSRLVRMKFCRTLPGSRHCHKLFINYILRLHVKRFIPARRDPPFVQPGSRFAGTKFSHVITSVRLGGIKNLIRKYP